MQPKKPRVELGIFIIIRLYLASPKDLGTQTPPGSIHHFMGSEKLCTQVIDISEMWPDMNWEDHTHKHMPVIGHYAIHQRSCWITLISVKNDNPASQWHPSIHLSAFSQSGTLNANRSSFLSWSHEIWQTAMRNADTRAFDYICG